MTSFPLAVIVYFSRLREVIARFFFVWSVSRDEMRGVKKMVCLPSLLSRPPAMSPDLSVGAHH